MQVVVDGKMYEKRKEAGKAILDKLKSIHTLKAVKDDVILTVGNIMGIEMRYKSSIGIMLTLPDLKYGYTIDLSHDLVGSMMKITNKVYGIEEIISSEEQFIKNRQVQLESSKREYAKEFKHEEQLFNLKVKLNEIDKELDRRAEAVKEEKAVQSGEGHHFDDEKSNNQQSTDDEPSVKFEKAKIHFDRDKGVQAYKADNEEMER
jgi:murein L,D-transpeptidase YafK